MHLSQIIYSDFEETGQLCLKKAHVLIAGKNGNLTIPVLLAQKLSGCYC
jgi:hypothetical protein